MLLTLGECLFTILVSTNHLWGDNCCCDFGHNFTPQCLWDSRCKETPWCQWDFLILMILPNVYETPRCQWDSPMSMRLPIQWDSPKSIRVTKKCYINNRTSKNCLALSFSTVVQCAFNTLLRNYITILYKVRKIFRTSGLVTDKLYQTSSLIHSAKHEHQVCL